MRLDGDGIKHLLYNAVPVLLPICEAEPEGSLAAVGHMEENRRDSLTASSLISARKMGSCLPRKGCF